MTTSTMNFDSYLKVLKPKPVVIRTQQSIFDHVVRTMVRQRMPCVVKDWTSGNIGLASFNSSGNVSALLSFFDRDDMRILKKVIGYERLQFMDEDTMYRSLITAPGQTTQARKIYEEISETEKEEAEKLMQFLKDRGFDYAGLMLLCKLEMRHEMWFDELDYSGFKSETNYENDTKSMHALHHLMSRFAYTEGYKDDVLAFVKP